MDEWPEIVRNFPLTIDSVAHKYILVPPDTSENFYHYTRRAGLQGILTSGGLRATYRRNMNDDEEFAYAKKIVYGELDRMMKDISLPKVAQCLIEATRSTLDEILDESTESYRGYCACLTIGKDDASQWNSYGDGGKGYALGFNAERLLWAQKPRVEEGHSWLRCLPVTYDETKQRSLVTKLLLNGTRDGQIFADQRSRNQNDLTALADRIAQKIVEYISLIIDFIKNPCYSNEREMRLLRIPGDSSRKAQDVKHDQRGNECIPYLFFDLRVPITQRMPLAEILVGPEASFPDGLAFVEDVLDKAGYGMDCYHDRPRIIHSALAKT